MTGSSLPKLAVFDMAGTTVEDQGEVPAAFTAALAAHEIRVTPEEINRVRGASKRQAILELVPEGPTRAEQADAAYRTFKDELSRRFAAGVRSVVGAAETFSWLRKRGGRVALNTGFDRDIAELLIAALGWKKDLVDVVVCGDDVPRGRPAPWLIFRCMERTDTASVHEVLAVGDTTLDLQAGFHAGVRWNIGVLSGAHARQQLEHAPHTHLLASVKELPALFADE